MDRISEIMDLPCSTFVDTHEKLVSDMKINLMEYFKTLRNMKQNPAGPLDNGIGIAPQAPKISLDRTADGFPIIPVPLASDNWTKHDWEILYSIYFGEHYREFIFWQLYEVLNNNNRA